MKFALRDDDLNYFFKPEEIENNYKDIWNICPISFSVVPFIKGNWLDITKKLESLGPGNTDANFIDKIKNDNIIYPIGENVLLVDYVKKKILENKIYLTLHGIHHRNEDEIIPEMNGNFGIGAEFFTNRDMTIKLKESIIYIQDLFNQRIEIFTPPQNLLSLKGIKSILNNDLSICGDMPALKKISTVKLVGFHNYLKLVFHRISNDMVTYPYPIVHKKLRFLTHYRLQPGSEVQKLYKSFKEIYKQNGVFVLSTHSYGFNFKMKDQGIRMGDVLTEFIHYAKQNPKVEFVNLAECFI